MVAKYRLNPFVIRSRSPTKGLLVLRLIHLLSQSLRNQVKVSDLTKTLAKKTEIVGLNPFVIRSRSPTK